MIGYTGDSTGILDGDDALRTPLAPNGTSRLEEAEEPARKKRRSTATVEQEPRITSGVLGNISSTLPMTVGEAAVVGPEIECEDNATAEELLEAVARPPPVNSSYLPLPWKGRLGYVRIHSPSPFP